MARWSDGGIMWSSVAIRYQLGLLRQAGSVTGSARVSTPHGTCESAMNAASAAGRSAPNEWGNLARSWNKNPPLGARIGDPGAPGGPAISVLTDSPLSGANAAM